MNEDKFAKLGPAWINNLRWDIKEKTAQPEDVELMMDYYSYLYESDEGIPTKTLREILKLLNQAFKEYLDRTANNGQFYGALDAAFGFSGKQGFQNLYNRDEDIATDVARYYLRGFSIKKATLKVGYERELGRTTIDKAWSLHKMDGIVRVQLELKSQGKQFTPNQLKRALKIEDQLRKKLDSFLKNTGR